MRRYLSVDCGGTKTAFLLCDETGKKSGACILGPGNYLVSGLDAVVEILKEGVAVVCGQSGIGQKDITKVFMAVAGLGDIPDDIPRVTEYIRAAFPDMSVDLGNDTDNALAGSLLGESGIHIIAGTGSIGLGYDGKKYIRSGGWHHLFGGDEGSGYWIGCQLIRHFTCQADGREAKSELYSYLMEKYDLGSPENILDLIINRWGGERERIASMSLDAFELAEREDSTAIAIFDHAAKELAAIIRSIYERGDFETPLKVSYSGGVFKAMEYLRASLEEALLAVPHELVQPILLPVEGGIVLAAKAAGRSISGEMVENLKASRRWNL